MNIDLKKWTGNAGYVALGVGLLAVIGSALLLSVGASPAEATREFWSGAFGTPMDFSTTLTAAVPLVLVALGWIVTLRAGRVHVGFPGQILIGGLFAGTAALQLDGLPAAVHLPVAMIAAALGGGLYAAIAAWLWASRGVQEIVSTLLLNLIAVQIVAYAVRGPLQESVGNQPQTDPLPTTALWPRMGFVEGGTLSWDVVLIPVAVVAVIFVLSRTTAGFRLRQVGANPVAARYAGYSPERVGVAAMLASGAFAGLAGGCLLLAGDTPGMTEGFEAHTGFNGIAVALLAFNSPLGAFFGALLFAAITVGSGTVEVLLDVPSTIASVLEGVIIVIVLVVATLMNRRRGMSAPVDPVQPVEPVHLEQAPLEPVGARSSGDQT